MILSKFNRDNSVPVCRGLTHRGRDEIATILQIKFPRAFSWIHFLFWLQLRCKLFIWATSQQLDNGSPLYRWQAIIWINNCLVSWHIYVSLGVGGLEEKNISKLIFWKFPVIFLDYYQQLPLKWFNFHSRNPNISTWISMIILQTIDIYIMDGISWRCWMLDKNYQS